VSRELEAGVNAYRQGDLRKAAASFAAALQQEPRSADAHQLLGLVAWKLGHPDDALKLLDRSLELDRKLVPALVNRALVLRDLGRDAEAVPSLERALRYRPDAPEAVRALGLTLLGLERFEQALPRLRRAVEQGPTAGLWADVGAAAFGVGRVDEGSAAWARARALDPAIACVSPGAAQALGRSLLGRGEREAAVSVLTEGLRAERAPELLAELGAALTLLGRGEAAVELLAEAVRAQPEESVPWLGLLDAAGLLTAPHPALTPLLPQAFAREGLDHQLLERLTRAVLAQELDLAPLLDGAPASAAALRALVEHPLLPPLLRRTLVRHPAWERLLAGLRAWMLRTADVPADALAALAAQAHYTEYAWWAEPDELAALATADASRRALYVEPDDGGALAAEAAAIPVLALTEDGVSIAVREMYEESPYPRLVSLHRKPPAPLARVLGPLLPHVTDLPDADPLDVLIAGCGTGQQAISAAARYQGARVLAVDLSRASLAMAARASAAQGLTNLELAQADILALGQLERRFHLVEAGGVLHHMADPLAGWRVLVGLLRPGGLMKIGLYSEAARAAVVAARAFVAERGFPPSSGGLREARRALLALPPEHPARAVVGSPDFASLSGTRDLIFHVCEHRYTLPRLRAELAALGLQLLGFQHSRPEVRAWYAELAPDDLGQADLSVWEQVEAAHPEAFAGMYQLWCRVG